MSWASLWRCWKPAKKWFDDAGCDNLDAFNKATGEGLPRLVFACDEVAELLDRTGRSKEDRDKLNQIENRLATLARLGGPLVFT